MKGMHKKRESYSKSILCIRKYKNNSNYGNGGKRAFIRANKGRLQEHYRESQRGFSGVPGDCRGFSRGYHDISDVINGVPRSSQGASGGSRRSQE